eukprot:CAMPEP_0197048504 /NCGR_PEP_ID=MMETSP1384-20130603/23842_1 /TAXON_ID=29189 /ORGANISM="Ammonia sp." /LENGTH=228 /DNA_ID=CAMNT_0042480647 /DNA_START=43 /DNA_END=729 /DNA_ORIENTATION=-
MSATCSRFVESASESFYKICRQCKDEDVSEHEVMAAMAEFIEQHGVHAIDINYRTERGDYGLKYVFKHTRPKVLRFLVQQFVMGDANLLDLFIIDNAQLRNNVLHYMIYAMGGNDDNKAAMEMIDILYGKENADKLDAYGLLYQFNEFQDTPITYCRKRKLVQLSMELERIKYIHIHDLLIAQCGIPYEMSHCIISYVFVVVYAPDLPDLSKMRNRWNVIVSPDAKPK